MLLSGRYLLAPVALSEVIIPFVPSTSCEQENHQRKWTYVIQCIARGRSISSWPSVDSVVCDRIARTAHWRHSYISNRQNARVSGRTHSWRRTASPLERNKSLWYRVSWATTAVTNAWQPCCYQFTSVGVLKLTLNKPSTYIGIWLRFVITNHTW